MEFFAALILTLSIRTLIMIKDYFPESPGTQKWFYQYRRRLVFMLVLIVLEIILAFSGYGFIYVGDLSITILQIPSIIAVIMLGLPEGLVLAGIFGFVSMYTAYVQTVGPLDYLFRNPLVAVVPRLMIPAAAWAGYKVIRAIADDHTLSAHLISAGIAATCGSVANTFFVVLALSIIYPDRIGLNQNFTARSVIVTNLIAANVLIEIIASAAATVLAILIGEAVHGKTASAPETPPAPIRKTFHKWLVLFMTVTFFAVLLFMYRLLSEQDRQNARRILQEKSRDITTQVALSGSSDRTLNLQFGNSGYVLLLENGIVKRSGKEQLEEHTAAQLGIDLDHLALHNMIFISVDGNRGACMLYRSKNTFILAFLPETEIYAESSRNGALLLAGLMIIFFAIYLSVSINVQNSVVRRIVDVNASLEEIRNGNLDETVGVTGNLEFAELSLGINTTVAALKATMNEITQRNRQELEFGREVQRSVLPAYDQFMTPDMPFEICGDMKAAREVGGDFYDYFLIGENQLGFVIADVSGKGIPAALLMMTAKTLVKNIVLGSKNPAESLNYANKQLCINNEKSMFVTLWLGILDFQKGVLEFANAAHNPPLLRKAGKPSVYMDHKNYRRSLMLGAMEETVYVNNRISFEPGDMLFLYTDGVTEATDRQERLYGEERLQSCIEANGSLPPEELIQAVHEDIDRFADGAEQFDDITMVVLKLKNPY